MKIEFLQKDLLSLSCDLAVLYVYQDVKRLSGAAGLVDKALDGALTALIQQDEFMAKMGQTLIVPTFGKIKARKVALIGLGDRKTLTSDGIRKIGGQIVALAEQIQAQRVATMLPGLGVAGLESRVVAQMLTEGLVLSAYRFHTYHGTLRKAEPQKKQVTQVTICEMDSRIRKSCLVGFERGMALAEATCYARDLVNTPSAHMTPAHLVDEAKKLIGKNMRLQIMNQKDMECRGMNAALAVARGSDHPPFGVHLTYRRAKAKKSIAVIGKAVTFDSGGLSLKPADGMMTMKIDMAGAAAVLGMCKALSVLRPNVEVHAVFLAVENMPSGRAYRPGDVVTAMDGTTIEVLNTDAEGRVTLADALSYARELKPDMMIDLATLTGACVVALGEEVSGLMSTDRALAQKLLDAAELAGEPLWELPLHEPYAELIKSKIADLKNIGGRSAGAITAGLFLKPFAGDIPWAHLDIAGPSYVEKETRPDQPYGASGCGVRTLMEFLTSL